MQITKKLIITNTLWSAVAQVGVMFINLLVLPLFVKNLGAELYGIWVLSGIVSGYLNVFDFGFTQGLQKYVAEARAKGDHLELSEVIVSGTGLLFFIGLLLGVGFFTGAQSIVEFFNIQPVNQLIAKRLLQISALFCLIMWPLRIVDVVLSASMRIKELGLLNAIKMAGRSTVMLGMVCVVDDIILIKWVTATLLAACSASGLVLLRKYVPEINWKPNNFRFSQLKRMHKFSLGIFYGAIIAIFSIQIDSLIIGRFLTMGAVTLYAVAAKPFQVIQQTAGLLMCTLVPATYTLGAQKDLFRLEKLVSQGVRMRSLVSIPCCVIAYLCIPDFIKIWVGNDFLESIKWAQYFLFVPIFASLGVGANVCKASGSLRLVNGLASAKIILNLIVSIALIKPFGIGGPILGTILSNFLLGDMLFFPLYCRRIGVGFQRGYRYFVQIILVSLFAGLMAWLFIKGINVVGIFGFVVKAALSAIMQIIFIGLFCVSRREKALAGKRVKDLLKTWILSI